MSHSTFANRYNTIVIGMGAMGSATAYQLAKRGKRVLGLEKFDVPHDMGSSHGYTRIIRMAYYEHPSYVMLLRRSYELWREIEERSGEKLLHITGSIDAGPADSWVFKGSLQSCIEHELPHEVFTGIELAQRFPGYNLPQQTLALYQPQGGFLAPERCIISHCFAAMALGAEIHGREAVLHWEPLGDEGVRVHTTRGVYEADSLVITAGAWNDEMLTFLRGLAVPERQVLAWFHPERPEYFRTDSFPVFNLLVDEGRFYGFPVHGVPGFKLGKYHHMQESGPADETYRDVTPEDEQILRDCTSRYFPRAAGPTMTLKTCLFTNAPDGHFLLDLHPQLPQVAYASACSGHGFKFASVIGEILADLAQHRQTRHNIELFSHERFLGMGTSSLQHSPSAVRRHQQQAAPGGLPSHGVRSHGSHSHGSHSHGAQYRYNGAGKSSSQRAYQQDESMHSPWL
jgi:sarcosine oxidase